MSLRMRVALATAMSVALAIAVVSVAVFFFAKDSLYAEVDQTLQGNSAGAIRFISSRVSVPAPDQRRATADGSARAALPDPQVVSIRQDCSSDGDASTGVAAAGRGALPPPEENAAVVARLSDWRAGVVCLSDAHLGEPLFAVDNAVLAVASGTSRGDIRTITIGGQAFRAATLPGPIAGLAFQSARPLDETERVLGRLFWLLVGVTVVGAALAGLVGWLISRPATAPVRRLVEATDHVTATRDLRRRVEVSGGDELARLGRSFNGMLEALEAAQQSQRQLVADASHELRTPVTSLRTNVEVLRRGGLSPAEGDELMADVVRQLEELGTIVTDVIDLARDSPAPAAFGPVRLDLVCAEAVERIRLHARGVTITLSASPCVVDGVAERLGRAVGNLLDNAVKWSPPGAVVEVAVADGEVRVADQGPGIDADEADRLFDRFYRSAAARGRPGSGLGLAVVRQIADEHRGTAGIGARAGGGTVATLAMAWAPPTLADGSEVGQDPLEQHPPVPLRTGGAARE